MNEDNKNELHANENVENADSYQTSVAEPDSSVGPTAAAETEAPSNTEQASESMPVENTAEEVESDTTYAVPAVPASAPEADAPKKSSKKLLLAVAAAVLVIVAGFAVWWFVTSGDGADSQDTSAVSSEPAKLGVAVSVADGTVEYGRNDSWQPLAADSDVQLAEGDLVRTGADSRAVLTLDDGSAVRLDESTEVKLVSLAADDVQIDHEKGSVYSRVVRSERSYTVAVDEKSYKALGTAFMTIKNEKDSGLQVFQSSVEVSGFETGVGEGQQYFATNADADLVNKVTNFDLKKFANDSFVAWNVAEDKKDAKFDGELGILSEYDKVVADEKARQKAEAEAKAKAEAEAKAAAEKARLEAERKAREAATPAPTAAMSVKFSDGGIFWTYAGTASDGFKVVYSATNTTPSFGQSGTTSVYVSEPRAQFLGLPKEMKAGKTYYVRVCAYQPNNSSTPCRDYSNVLRIN